MGFLTYPSLISYYELQLWSEAVIISIESIRKIARDVNSFCLWPLNRFVMCYILCYTLNVIIGLLSSVGTDLAPKLEFSGIEEIFGRRGQLAATVWYL